MTENTSTGLVSNIYEKGSELTPEERAEAERALGAQGGATGGVAEKGASVAIVYTEELAEQIRETVARVIGEKAERRSITQEITSHYDGIVAKGIDKKALKFAVTLAEMKEHDRDAMLISLEICMRALNIGQQLDMFGGRMTGGSVN